MPTPFEEFEFSVFAAIDRSKIYTKDAVIGGDQGVTTVDFNYVDGIASNVTVTKSSKSKELDGASKNTISRATLPPPPQAYAGKTLHMEVLFCYALYQSDKDPRRCPTAGNVILVTGTRIRRSGS